MIYDAFISSIFHYILLYFSFIFYTLKLMNTSCEIKRKNRCCVENENSKMNTDSSEDGISLINNNTYSITYIITLCDNQMLRSPR